MARASQHQIVEALAFVYSKTGGWWGHLYHNARLVLSLSLWKAAVKHGLHPFYAEVGLAARWRRHQAGEVYRDFSGQN